MTSKDLQEQTKIVLSTSVPQATLDKLTIKARNGGTSSSILSLMVRLPRVLLIMPRPGGPLLGQNLVIALLQSRLVPHFT